MKKTFLFLCALLVWLPAHAALAPLHTCALSLARAEGRVRIGDRLQVGVRGAEPVPMIFGGRILDARAARLLFVPFGDRTNDAILELSEKDISFSVGGKRAPARSQALSFETIEVPVRQPSLKSCAPTTTLMCLHHLDRLGLLPAALSKRVRCADFASPLFSTLDDRIGADAHERRRRARPWRERLLACIGIGDLPSQEKELESWLAEEGVAFHAGADLDELDSHLERGLPAYMAVPVQRLESVLELHPGRYDPELVHNRGGRMRPSPDLIYGGHAVAVVRRIRISDEKTGWDGQRYLVLNPGTGQVELWSKWEVMRAHPKLILMGG